MGADEWLLGNWRRREIKYKTATCRNFRVLGLFRILLFCGYVSMNLLNPQNCM